MSYGAVVHATVQDRELRAERRTAEAAELARSRREWAAQHLPDLPAEFVATSIGTLRFAGVEPTLERIRARTEASLRRFLDETELAALKANGAALQPAVET